MGSDRTRVRRHSERGRYERAEIDAILDEALFCHVGFVHGGRPFVIPTIHARIGDDLYIHGSPASRMLRELAGEIDVCVTVTLLDGIVLARSVYNHSLNYRSAVVLGRARELEGQAEKRKALEAVVEHVVPGRSHEARVRATRSLPARPCSRSRSTRPRPRSGRGRPASSRRTSSSRSGRRDPAEHRGGRGADG